MLMGKFSEENSSDDRKRVYCQVRANRDFYHLGSTYEHEFDSDEPDEKMAKELVMEKSLCLFEKCESV